MHRRTVLSAAAVGAAAVAGCGGVLPEGDDGVDDDPADDRAADEPEPDEEGVPRGDEFETVVDLVAEGADPTGEESIRPFLEEFADDDTLLYLSEGRFYVDDIWWEQELTGFGILGDDATIVPPADEPTRLLNVDGGRDALVAGLTFDYTESVGGRALQVVVADGLEVVDVSVIGRLEEGPGPIRVDVTDPGGEGTVERLAFPDGATAESIATGVYVGNRNQGDVTFSDCHIEGFPDNGLYADPPEGTVTVDGGYFANNGISNVRIRGGSIVRDAHIRCDDGPRNFPNMRGIRATDYEAREESEPAVVEGCRVELLDVTHSDGAIVLGTGLAALEIRDTHVRVDTDGVYGVLVTTPDEIVAEGESRPRLTCADLTVTGRAEGASAIRIADRDGCEIRDLLVYQSGADRDGIQFHRSNDNTVTDSVIEVRGEPIRFVDATARVERTISTRSPPFPFGR